MDKIKNTKRALLLLLVFLPLIATAQVQEQKGYVKTVGRYNAPGTRISNVSVRIQGNHNTVMSDKNGDFSMPIHTDSYVLNSIFKSGYELQEKEAIGRLYAYSSTVPLEIVMISSMELLKEKQTIEERIRANIEKEYKTQYDTLEKQLKAKTISEENYRSQLAELQHKSDNNTRLISDMADRYARTDYDKLDTINQQINYWIQEGKLELADSLLHSKGSLEEREQKLLEFKTYNETTEKELMQNKENARKERDDLAQDYYSAYSLALLRLKNDSAAYFLEKRVMLDSTNVEYLSEAGNFIQEYIADYDKALRYYKKALSLSLEQNSENHPDVATSYSNIGSVYDALGDYNSALEYHKKSLMIRENIYNSDHPEIATSYNDIGAIYKYQGNYTFAMEYYKKSLVIREKILGLEHPDVGVSYNNLGGLYHSQGDFISALKYYKKSLVINEKVFGIEHPDIAISYNNIGAVYKSQGNYTLALEYYKKSLLISEKLFGLKHPDVANRYNNIGGVYDSMGDYILALEYYKKSLAIFEKVFGTEHPALATIYNNIGGIFSSQNNYTLSLEYYKKSLIILKKILGQYHPALATIYNNIGVVYIAQDIYTAALDYFKKSLEIYKKKMGTKNLDVALSYNNIGSVYYSQRNYVLALEHFNKSLSIRKNILDSEHPDIAVSYNNIGNVYYNQNDYMSALKYYKNSLSIRLKILGPKHPSTTNLLISIYNCYTDIIRKVKKDSIEYKTLKEEFDFFMEEKIFTIEFLKNNNSVINENLNNSYVCAFESWDLKSTENLIDLSQNLRNKPKTLVLIKDNIISINQLESNINIKLNLNIIPQKEKIRLLKLYQNEK